MPQNAEFGKCVLLALRTSADGQALDSSSIFFMHNMYIFIHLYTGLTKVALLEGQSFSRKKPTGMRAVNFGPGKPFIIVSFTWCDT